MLSATEAVCFHASLAETHMRAAFISVCMYLFAEELFIGWLPDKKWSWRVVAGQNVAYDQFPCQYQLYYRGKAKNSLWYDPVFQVAIPPYFVCVA